MSIQPEPFSIKYKDDLYRVVFDHTNEKIYLLLIFNIFLTELNKLFLL
jgi:hypothetical protein